MKPASLLLILAAMVWTAAAPTLRAQSPTAEKEPVPDAPLMAPAPADTQWTIVYTQKTQLKEPTTPDEIRNQKIRLRYSPQVISKRVQKGEGGQMVIYTTYEANLKSESWVVGNLLFDLPIYEGEMIQSRSIAAGDFPEISWVSPENFRGTVDLKGRKAHLYETGGPTAGSEPRPNPNSGAASPEKAGGGTSGPAQRAYIDVKSRLPLVADTGTVSWTYQYSAASASFPALNPRIQKMVQDHDTKSARRTNR